jgi:DNA-binding CsgD family transcriptional regulator
MDSVDEIINNAIKEIEGIADDLPCVIFLHDLRDWTIEWMSANGLQLLGITQEQLRSMSYEEYFSRFFNREDTDDWVPKVLSLLEKNNSDDICTYIHQIRFSKNSDWKWYMGSVKIFSWDTEGKPLLVVTMVFPIDNMHRMTTKAQKLLEEKNFLRRNFHLYKRLSKREKDILKLLALGKTAPETAEQLFISINTVETHRKNIKQKLETTSYYQLCEYARAFDLV